MVYNLEKSFVCKKPFEPIELIEPFKQRTKTNNLLPVILFCIKIP